MAGSDHLKAGETGRLIARISATTGRGTVFEKIEVVSNDPKRPKVTLTLRAHIR